MSTLGLQHPWVLLKLDMFFFWKPRIHLYAQGCPYCRTWFTTPFNKNLASDSCRKKECVEFVFCCAGIVFHNFGTSNLIMAFLYLSYYVLPEAHESHRFCPCEDYGIGSNPFSLSMADLLPDDLATMILVNQRQRFIDLSGPLFRSKGRKKHGKKLDPKHLKIICRWFAWMRVITCPINSNVLQVGLGWVRVRVGIRRPWIFLQVEALPSTWPVLKVGDICVEGKGINECPPPQKKRTTVVWIHHTSWHEDGHFVGIPVVETSRLFEGSLPLCWATRVQNGRGRSWRTFVGRSLWILVAYGA